MDELTVQKTRCTCHPETCGHWPYSLMLGSERITTGEKADCERLLALLTTRNTRAASGGDSASLEQRADDLFWSLMQAPYADTTIGNIVCAETTPQRLESAWMPLLTAALANQQGADYYLNAKGIAESIENGDGVWVSCTGCLETEDGHHVGRYHYSKAFRCHLGGGCSECGGIGAVWDTTDYAAFGDFLAADPQPAGANQQGVENEV